MFSMVKRKQESIEMEVDARVYQTFTELAAKMQNLGVVTIAVAGADDKDVLAAIKMAVDMGFAKAILVGKHTKILSLLEEIGLQNNIEIIDAADEIEAAEIAVELVKIKKAEVIMKGMVNTSDFLRAVLGKLRKGKLLSHLAAFEIPGEPKIVFHTDGGMNIAPNLEEKKEILRNAVDIMRKLGYERINIACLAANEKVDDKAAATVDARELQDANGEFPNCVIEGPIALDVAISKNAASHKGLSSKIAGEVDLFLVPSIEVGNVLGKALIHYKEAKMAGIIVGASNPIVLTSRAETAEGKLNSIALACLAGVS